LPAIVNVPLRGAPLFAAAPTTTVPLPEPLAPAVTVSQFAWLEAVHPQPDPAVTVNVVEDAVSGTVADGGPTANVHAGAAAA